MEEIGYELGYVRASVHRRQILKTLENCNGKMPSTIAKQTQIKPTNISTYLKQLKEKDLIECIKPEVRKGKLYRLTVKGKKILNYI